MDSLKAAIVDSVGSSATLPLDIEVSETCSEIDGLSVSISPEVVPEVPPGGTACFDATFVNSNADLTGGCVLEFLKAGTEIGLCATIAYPI